jgi:hypothetical protein
MENFDFLDSMGHSKEKYKTVKTSKSLKEKILLLDNLISRNLMDDSFKETLLDLICNKNMNDYDFNFNVQKSITSYQSLEFKLTSIDESLFKLKGNESEYIGSIERDLNDKRPINSDSGKVSLNFARELFKNLENKIITGNELITMSDIFGFDLFKVFNMDCINNPS